VAAGFLLRRRKREERGKKAVHHKSEAALNEWKTLLATPPLPFCRFARHYTEWGEPSTGPGTPSSVTSLLSSKSARYHLSFNIQHPLS
jgi:hypothetical protein